MIFGKNDISFEKVWIIKGLSHNDYVIKRLYDPLKRLNRPGQSCDVGWGTYTA